MPVSFSTERVIKQPLQGVSEKTTSEGFAPVGIPEGFEPNQPSKAPSRVKFSVEKPVAAPKGGPGETVVNVAKGLGRGFETMLQGLGRAMQWAAEEGTTPEGATSFKKSAGAIASKIIPIPVAGQKAGEYVGSIADKIRPEWHKNLDIWARNAAKKVGQNVVAYYQKGIDGDILSPTPDFMQAQKLGWTTLPFEKALVATAESAPSFVSAVAAGLITKNPHVPLALLGGMQATQTYGALRDQNIDQEVASTAAFMSGAWEAATEKLPFDELMKGPAKNALKRFLKVGSMESFQELLAQLGGNYINFAAKEYKPGDLKTVLPALKIQWGELANGWFEAMSAGFLMGGGAAMAVKPAQEGPTVEAAAKQPTPDPVFTQDELASIEEVAAQQVTPQPAQQVVPPAPAAEEGNVRAIVLPEETGLKKKNIRFGTMDALFKEIDTPKEGEQGLQVTRDEFLEIGKTLAENQDTTNQELRGRVYYPYGGKQQGIYDVILGSAIGKAGSRLYVVAEVNDKTNVPTGRIRIHGTPVSMTETIGEISNFNALFPAPVTETTQENVTKPLQINITAEETTPIQATDISDIKTLQQQVDKAPMTGKQRLLLKNYIGDIETKVVKEIVDKYPEPITDQASLERVGNKIAKDLGVEGAVTWAWDTTMARRAYGTHAKKPDGSNIIRINVKAHYKDGKTLDVRELKDTIVHELGHIAKPPTKSTFKLQKNVKVEKNPRGGYYVTIPGKKLYQVDWAQSEQEALDAVVKGVRGRRAVHHSNFKKWLAENLKSVLPSEVTKRIPLLNDVTLPPDGYESVESFTDPATSPLVTGQYAILTAENPGGKGGTAAENKKRNDDLKERLLQDGYEPIPVDGFYGGVKENSFLVPDMSDGDALTYGKIAGQESVLVPGGLLYQDGHYHPSDLQNIDFSGKQGDFYSVIRIGGKPIKFSVPIDFNRTEQSTARAGKEGASISDKYPDARDQSRSKQNVIIDKKIGNAPRNELLVQFSSDLLTQGKEDPQAREYYDKLHAKREGYDIPGDFWEVPTWIPVAANLVPNAEAAVVRDIDSFIEQVHQRGYKTLFFSALDVNKAFIKQIASKFKGRVVIGGYVDPAYFKGLDNVTFYKSMKEMAEKEGYVFKEGQDYRHFQDTETQPRLCLSEGCKHKCAFCGVKKDLTPRSRRNIVQQINALRDSGLKFQYVYLDDKTFGQSDTSKLLRQAYNKIKAFNPDFDGFIIQTTASQFNQMDPAKLVADGVRIAELGVESFNDEILKKYHKPATEKSINKAVQTMRENGIIFIPNIIIGMPEETAATYARTMQFLRENADIISHVNAYNLAVYAGTELGDSIKTDADIDVNENSVTKSFHKDPQLHLDFANEVYTFGMEQLDKAPAFPAAASKQIEVKVFDKTIPVTVNPSSEDYQRLSEKFNREFPNAPVGTPSIRTLYDTKGNKYIWNADKAGHLEAMKALAEKFNLPVEEFTQQQGEQVKTPSEKRTTKPKAFTQEQIEALQAKGYKPVDIVKMSVPDGLKILGIEVKPERPAKPANPATNDQKMRINILAKNLGMTTEQRRDLQQSLTGKNSLRNMTVDEAAVVDQYLTRLATEKGLITATAQELTARLREANLMPDEKPEVKGKREKGLRKIITTINEGVHNFMDRIWHIDRLVEQLDGMEKGPLYNTIWRKVRDGMNSAADAKHDRIQKFKNAGESIFGDADKFSQFLTAPEQDLGGGVKLSPSERVGVYVYSKNKDSLRHLLGGNFAGFPDTQIALVRVLETVTPQERAMGEWILQDMAENFDRVNQASVLSLGRELTEQDNYFSMYLSEVELEQQDDFLSALLDLQRQPGVVSEPGETVARKKGAKQPIRLDAVANYLHHVDRLEQFVHMGPIARQVGGILNNREFKRTLNIITHNTGSSILNKWLRDSTLGYSAEGTSWMARQILFFRQAGVQFAMGWKIPSVMRQFLSLPTAAAVHPSVGARVGIHLTKSVKPSYYRRLQDTAFSKSAMMRHRSMERISDYINTRMTPAQRMRYRRNWSQSAMAWMQWADRHTAVIAWNGLYDSALHSPAVIKQFGLDGSEKAAIEFADDWVGRTQSMGNVTYLSDFFRGGVVEKLLTTFQNEDNTKWNFWAHDVIQSKRAGLIDKKMVAYRLLLSYVLPALLFGIIGRGRLQKNWKEVVFDESTYVLGPLFLAGRMVYNAVQGFAGGASGPEEIGWVELEKTVQNALEGKGGKAALHGVKAAGALTGRIPSQAITTGTGAYELMTGETTDLRRLIYTDWSLTKYGTQFNDKEEQQGKPNYGPRK